ncbi:MAG: class A beta-lactamase [Bradyrhizobium sp.]|uniref:class A beta-lactamase n=1 Tax=Bradyrhizobium sp. TaxID=376 RepID=UPI001D2E61CE|nr:class A beta-lactamase [Bradyrhizobium sp.]MBV9563285.1 class A beta-lactamase [Bradyrhizobium sp.]
MLTRRAFAKFSLLPLVGGFSIEAGGPAVTGDRGFSKLEEALAKIELESSGRLGVAVLDLESGTQAGHRAYERFPMCSTFKALTAAAVLARVDAGKEQLDRRVAVVQSDILAYAPATKQHVGGDGMSIAELCEAAVTLSDNTAANLLLRSMGGPSAITDYARSLGDQITRLDRIEPDLNEATPGDERDSTTPFALATDLQALAVGVALSVASREQLIAWLVGCKTGDAKLRAGLPKDWKVGDKTGSGNHGSSNDVAVIWPAGRKPLIITSYLTETEASDDQRNATHAAVGRAVAEMAVG